MAAKSGPRARRAPFHPPARGKAVTDDAVVADDSRGEDTCLMTTFGSGLRIRRSCSLTSSAARASTFSAFVLSDSLRPRKSTDSTFR